MMTRAFYPPNPAFRWNLQHENGQPQYELVESTVYDDGSEDGPYPIDAGSRSNGVSSPRRLWSFMPPVGDELLPAWLHDDLLRNRPPGWSRAKIDRKFRESMRCTGTPQWKRNLAYAAVRYQAWRTNDR